MLLHPERFRLEGYLKVQSFYEFARSSMMNYSKQRSPKHFKLVLGNSLSLLMRNEKVLTLSLYRYIHPPFYRERAQEPLLTISFHLEG